MTHKVKWGVVGSGGIAKRRTIPEGIVPSSNGVLAAVYDVQTNVNQLIAEGCGAYAASSFENLLDSDIDAVYIATPANLHCQQVIACAKAKKHVLCEKPLGLSVSEAETMIQACREEGVMLGTALMMRFHTQHQAVLDLVRQGRLGTPVYGRAQLSCWYPPIKNAWRQDPAQGGGGSLIDMGNHCIDLLEMFFGPIAKVSCCINNTIHSYASEDSAVVILYFENGAMATVDSFFCIPDESSKNRLELYGSKGSVLAQGTVGQGDGGETVAYLQDDDSGYNAHQQRKEGGGIAIAPPPKNTYQAEIEEFGAAILERREPSSNAAIGLRNQVVLAACYESAKSGRVVEIGSAS